jgi:mono/diheme cytochrome c family protein
MNMKKTLFWLTVLAVLGAMALSACGGGSQPATDSTTRPDAPAPYAGKTNSLTADAASVEKGKETYTTNCVSCHGDTGMGDGPSAASLDPKPKPLAKEVSILKDDYMLWRISEGGAMAPFNSAMPAWKTSLSEEQIWQVIAYLRTMKQ